MASKLNMADVRGSFPALSGDQVFLDNAGGSQTLSTVIDRLHIPHAITTLPQLTPTASPITSSIPTCN